jgi:hypothetical protein
MIQRDVRVFKRRWDTFIIKLRPGLFHFASSC